MTRAAEVCARLTHPGHTSTAAHHATTPLTFQPIRLALTHVCSLEADIFTHLPSRLLALFVITGFTGCALTYQPLTGLHTPVVVDTSAPNLAEQSITVHCVTTDGMNDVHRDRLCRRVGSLFEQQGASVHVVDGDHRADPSADEHVADLVVELRPRRVPVDDHAASWVLSAATLTLVPAVVELPFAVDVSIRDGGGFLLEEAFLEGRVIARFGLSAWVTAGLANRSWRRDSPKTSRRASAQALSADVYEQLSQLAVNATTQRQILQAALSVQP